MQTFLALASFPRRNSPRWRVINRFMISFRGVVREIDLFKILRLSLRRIRARVFGTINKFAFDVSAKFRELLRYLNRETSLHRFLPSFKNWQSQFITVLHGKLRFISLSREFWWPLTSRPLHFTALSAICENRPTSVLNIRDIAVTN